MIVNVRRNLVANLLGQGWSAAINLVAVPIYLKLLGPENFGLIGFATVILVLAYLLDGGLGNTLNRSMVHFRAGSLSAQAASDLLRSGEAAIWGAAMLIGAIAFGLSSHLAHWLIDARQLPDTAVAQALTLSIVIALMRVTEGIYRSALLGLDGAISVNVLSVAGATLRGLGPLPFVLHSRGGILTYFSVQLIVSTVSLFAFAGLTHIRLEGTPFGRGGIRLDPLRSVFRFAGDAFVVSSLIAVANQADKLLAARLTSLERFGYYSAAAIVATGIYQLVVPVFMSFYPKLSLLHATRKQGEFERLFLKLAVVVGFIAGVPTAVIIANSQDVVFAWTGNVVTATRTSPLLFWLCFGTWANGLFYIALAPLLASARHRIAVVTTGVLLLTLLPLLLLGWLEADLVGIAAAWSAAMVVWSLLTLALTGRAVTGSPFLAKLFAASLSPFLLALLCSYAIRNLAPHPAVQSQAFEAVSVLLNATLIGTITAGALWTASFAISGSSKT